MIAQGQKWLCRTRLHGAGASAARPTSIPLISHMRCVHTSPAVPIFDGQLSAIAAEMEGKDPEECQIQVR